MGRLDVMADGLRELSDRWLTKADSSLEYPGHRRLILREVIHSEDGGYDVYKFLVAKYKWGTMASCGLSTGARVLVKPEDLEMLREQTGEEFVEHVVSEMEDAVVDEMGECYSLLGRRAGRTLVDAFVGSNFRALDINGLAYALLGREGWYSFSALDTGSGRELFCNKGLLNTSARRVYRLPEGVSVLDRSGDGVEGELMSDDDKEILGSYFSDVLMWNQELVRRNVI